MNKIGQRHKNIKFIHIAGTNGKGSVAANINQILIESGINVGKFSTPYLETYNETITFNNEKIKNFEIRKVLKKIMPIIAECENYHQIRWFDVSVFIAMVYFIDKKCDFVILETGLGGTTDSTNFVDSIISIITSIGIDHKDLLGSTIDLISNHKFGIIKDDSLVIAMDDIPEKKKLGEIAANKNSVAIFPTMNDVSETLFGTQYTIFTYLNSEYTTPLIGKKQIQNAILSIECVKALAQYGYYISNETIKKGLENVHHNGRWEKIIKNPLIIFDGAHNEQAIENFAWNANQLYLNTAKKIVFSCLKSKDYRANIFQLKSIKNCHIIFTPGINEKFIDAETLFTEGQKIRLSCSIDKKFSHAVRSLKKEKNAVCFVLGSFYVYKKTLKILHVKH